MPLPKITTPEYTLHLPLSNKTVTFRPYTVQDEKLLLQASSARDSDPTFFVNNTSRVIRNCLNGDPDNLIDTVPAVEIELLLMHIRAKSVSELIELVYTDPETKRKHDLALDITAFTVEVDPDRTDKIALTDEVGLIMKDLSFAQKMQYAKQDKNKAATDLIFETIVDSVSAIYDADNVYVVGQDCTRKEVQEFIEGLSGHSNKLYTYLAKTPVIVAHAVIPETGKKITLKSSEVDFLASSAAT